jgi:multidrug efflux pump subunit AcrB
MNTEDKLPFWQSSLFKKIAVIISILLVIAVIALGAKAFGSHKQSSGSSTKSSLSVSESNIKKKDQARSHSVSEASRQSTIKKITASSSATSSSDNVSSTTKVIKGSSPNNENANANNVQKRIQSSLPKLTIGSTTIETKGNVSVSSAGDNNKVTTTLSSQGHDFATITTEDGSDTLSLLPGYQNYVNEHVNTK